MFDYLCVMINAHFQWIYIASLRGYVYPLKMSIFIKFLIKIINQFSIFRIIAQMGPEDSWVAKWQRIGNILLYGQAHEIWYLLSPVDMHAHYCSLIRDFTGHKHRVLFVFSHVMRFFFLPGLNQYGGVPF